MYLKAVLFPKLKPPIFSLHSPSNHQPLVETRTLSQTQTADIPQSKHTHLPTWESLALQMLAIHFNDTTPRWRPPSLPLGHSTFGITTTEMFGFTYRGAKRT